jgi:4-hydroxybenzoate polyprenyltransferase
MQAGFDLFVRQHGGKLTTKHRKHTKQKSCRLNVERRRFCVARFQRRDAVETFNLQPATCNFQPLTTLLTLGRVSNLPTVWSNCIAAWMLAGGGLDARLEFVCAGGSSLYVGGMFLNDACDVSFDREHRTERPIPSGAISRAAVFVWSVVWLALGMALLLFGGQASLVLMTMLLVAIVTYNFLHKLFPPSIVLMAVCRFLLYLVAASGFQNSKPETRNSELLLAAAVMAVYVLGISLLARNESLRQGRRTIIPTVGRLLAGIVLVDWLNVVCAQGWMLYEALIFAALFLLALLVQKCVAAT